MIIAIKEKDRVVVGYSNTDYWGKLAEKDYVDEENVPIKFSKDGTLFGFAKMNCQSDMFIFDDDFINQDITPKTVVKNVIPYIKKTLKKNGQALDEEGRWRNILTICNGNKIYDITTNFAFYEADDYVCHGFSVDILKSVLDGTIGMSAEERIIKATSFASKLHKEDLFPLTIVDTKTKSFKVVDGFNIKEDNK